MTPSGSMRRLRPPWPSLCVGWTICRLPCFLQSGRQTPKLSRPALAAALPDERLRRARVGPLSLGALHSLIRQRLGMTFPRPVLGRLHKPQAAIRSTRSSSPARSDGAAAAPILTTSSCAPIVARARRGTARRAACGNPRAARPRSRAGAALGAAARCRARRRRLSASSAGGRGAGGRARRRRASRLPIRYSRPSSSRALSARRAAPRAQPSRRGGTRSGGTGAPPCPRRRPTRRRRGRCSRHGGQPRRCREVPPTPRPSSSSTPVASLHRIAPRIGRRRVVRAAEFHLEAGETTRAEELLEEASPHRPSGLSGRRSPAPFWVRGHKDSMARSTCLTQALREAGGEVR